MRLFRLFVFSHFSARSRCGEIATASGGRIRTAIVRKMGKSSSRVIVRPRSSRPHRSRANRTVAGPGVGSVGAYFILLIGIRYE